MAKDFEQTNIAFVSSSFARTFNNAFFEQRISGYVAWMNEPEEQSTGGGLRARQPMVLRSADKRPVIAIGWCNVATKECNLRSYDCVVEQHQRRFPDRPSDIDRAAYDAWVGAIRPFFEQRGMRLTIEEPTQSTPPPALGRQASAADPHAAKHAPAVISAAARNIAVAKPEPSWLRENLVLALVVGGVLLASALAVLYSTLLR